MPTHKQSSPSWNLLARWRLTIPSVRERRQPQRLHLTGEELEPRVVPTLLGQNIFPADNPINQNIAAAPVLANSNAITDSLLNFLHSSNDPGPYDAGVGVDTGAKLNIVHGNSVSPTPVQDWHEYAGNYTSTVYIPMPSNVVVCGEDYGRPGSHYNVNDDNHMIIWDEDNNILYETYHTARPTENWSDYNGQHAADGRWHIANVTVIDLNTNDFENATTAGGISFGAMMARPDEGLPVNEGGQGAINHALYLELDSRWMAERAWTYPAQNFAYDSAVTPNGVPMGLRLRLKASVDVSGLNPQSQILATALKNYGAIVNDTYGIGVGMTIDAVTYTPDANNQWDGTHLSWATYGGLSLGLPLSDFEWVDLSPQVTGLSETSGSAGDTITITGQNFSYANSTTVNGVSVNSSGLSVLFGGRPATNVTLVDDGTITATVPPAPAGYGTVAVQVQSGVSQAGLGLPGGNLNSPIFGYGLSKQYVTFSYGSGTTESDPSVPPAPIDLTATTDDSQVTLNWSSTSGATSYNLYRGTVGGAESLLQRGVAPGYTDTSVTNGTPYFYQVVAVNGVGASTPSNEVAVMPNPQAPVLDPSFESDSIVTDIINSVPAELTGFSSFAWEQAAYSDTTGFTYYYVPNWGARGNMAPGYEGAGNPHNPSADHSGTVAGVWDPTTDNWAAGGNPFPNGGYDGSQVAWVDALTSGTVNFNAIVQQSSVVFQADTTYTLTVAVGARTDTAFGGYQIELEYGYIDPVTGIVYGTVVSSISSGQAPVAGGFGDVTLTYTTPDSGDMIGQYLLIVLATNPANNAYNPHTGLTAGNSQVMPQTDFDNVRLTNGTDRMTGSAVRATDNSILNTYLVSGKGVNIATISDQSDHVGMSLIGGVLFVYPISWTNAHPWAAPEARAPETLLPRSRFRVVGHHTVDFLSLDNSGLLDGNELIPFGEGHQHQVLEMHLLRDLVAV